MANCSLCAYQQISKIVLLSAYQKIQIMLKNIIIHPKKDSMPNRPLSMRRLRPPVATKRTGLRIAGD
jgi:hypothetical protein